MEASIHQLPQRFNVRVYGLLIKDQNQVLISRETYNGMRLTKFPGGGLEFGEGVEDALKREFREELGLEVEAERLFYINEFLQISAFDPKDQLLAIYYLIRPASSASSRWANIANSALSQEEHVAFEWVMINQLGEAKLSFPVDKIVAGKLMDDIG